MALTDDESMAEITINPIKPPYPFEAYARIIEPLVGRGQHKKSLLHDYDVSKEYPLMQILEGMASIKLPIFEFL